jgi:hypothetical protein
MPSKSTWTLLVSIAWVIAQPYLPLPERWKPAFAFVSLCILAFTLVGWLFAHSENIQRFRHGPKGSRVLTVIVIGLIGAAITITLWKFVGEPPAPAETKADDFKMTVTSYRYSSETKEMIAQVQFINNGQMRRIVMGAMFLYERPPGVEQEQNARHYIIESMEELRSQGDLQTPLYVEPGQPILTTFRHKVVDETPLNTPGTVFGIEISSLTATGGRNTTWVEVMEVVGDLKDPTKSIGHITGRKETISLDVPWGNNPMETQSQLRAQIEAKSPPIKPAQLPAPTANDLPRPFVEESPKMVSPRTHTAGSPTEKKFANVDELLAHFEGLTPFQAAKEIESYKNFWLEVEGASRGYPRPQGAGCALEIQLGANRPVQCYFIAQSCEELDKTNPDEIYVRKVRGKFLHYDKPHLTLSDCELISTRLP